MGHTACLTYYSDAKSHVVLLDPCINEEANSKILSRIDMLSTGNKDDLNMQLHFRTSCT